jgi:cellulose synthase/poly-beta-1,6-N-acetylglucosamine synthase-like glycosyltransferase
MSMDAFQHSFWLVYQSQYLLLLLSVLVFDVPRYILSIFALTLLTRPERTASNQPMPSVSIVLAVFNGADGLLDTLKATRQQSLPPMEVILVNDGSSDHTRDIALIAIERGLINQYIHHGTRCGKSASINHAVRFATGELVLSIDHDTLIEPDAIEKLACAFTDAQTALVSGNLSVRNRKQSLWTSLQAVEYLISITAGRSFLDLFGAVSCCSGAFSMFRRDVYVSMGGNNTGPGEDFELTLRMRKLGHKVRFISDAYASVDAPHTLDGLIRQRLRWDRDALNIRINQYHNLDLFHPKDMLSDTLHILDFIIFELIPTSVFPFYILYILLLLGSLAIPYLITIYIVVLGIYMIGILLAVTIEPRQIGLFELAVLPIFPIYQGVIMKLIRFLAFAHEVLFRDSRHDDYVPPRIRRAIYGKDG